MFFFAKNQHDVCPNSEKAYKTFEKHYNTLPNVIFIQSFFNHFVRLVFNIQEYCIIFATE